MEALLDQMSFCQIAIKVAYGGYMVTALVPVEDEEDDASYRTVSAIYSDLDNMAEYVKRLAKGLESEEPFKHLGPLTVTD
jgi:hypothetical protein